MFDNFIAPQFRLTRILGLMLIVLCNCCHETPRLSEMEKSDFLEFSEDGHYALFGTLKVQHDVTTTSYSLVRIQDLGNRAFELIKALPSGLRTVKFCGSDALVYLESNSIETRLISVKYLLNDSSEILFSDHNLSYAENWILNIQDFEILLRDSLIAYKEVNGIVLRKILPNSKSTVIREFCGGLECAFSNDGNELIIVMATATDSVNSITNNDSVDYVIFHNLLTSTVSNGFSSSPLGGPTPPKSNDSHSKVYFLSLYPSEEVNNVWAFTRDDSTFERITNFKYPIHVSSFHLCFDEIICLVRNLETQKSQYKSIRLDNN